jgi:hypothetical protein
MTRFSVEFPAYYCFAESWVLLTPVDHACLDVDRGVSRVAALGILVWDILNLTHVPVFECPGISWIFQASARHVLITANTTALMRTDIDQAIVDCLPYSLSAELTHMLPGATATHTNVCRIRTLGPRTGSGRDSQGGVRIEWLWSAHQVIVGVHLMRQRYSQSVF